jgi:DNA-binding transcriptional LysR family regulator
MDFYQLAYFRKVVETRSISRAAEEIHITQPAVSKQIRSLEEELGARLFDRIGKKLYLTKTGELFNSYAERILRSVQEARAAVKDMTEECSGELVIGTSDHIGLHRLPDVLKAFIAAYPKVDLKLRCHRSETILDMVSRNQVDLGVITLPGVTANIVSKTIWKDTLSPVFPGNHPLAAMKILRLKDMARHGMILPESGTTTRKIIDSAFSRKGLVPNVIMEVAYIETIKVLVKVGLGISILPDKAVDQEVLAGSLARAEISGVRFSRNLGVVHLKGKFLSRPALEFIACLERDAGKGVS